MESLNKQKWDDLNLSNDELKSIGQALQKEEFRNLLLEYVKEINDPENRKQYEREITQLENERGVDIKFLHPSSGYVIKTSADGINKCFINICTNSNVEKPSSTPDVDGGYHGLFWSIPYCLAPSREDVDKKNSACTVYDVVFHPDTLHLTKNNSAFKKLVDDTAIGAVEENFHVSLDKINLKFPKMQFKGVKHATVIRKKIKNFQPTEFLNIPNYPYPPVKEDIQTDSGSFQKKYNDDLSSPKKDTKYTVPKYTVKHRNTVDMQNYTNDPMSKISITVPSELVIVIDLPLLKCATDTSIDVTGNSLFLLSENPAKYKLNLNLPYIVDNNRGNAKFDIAKKILTVTLPVIKQKVYTNTDSAREDSGFDSDNCCGRSNSVSSGDEDAIEKKSSLNDAELSKDVSNIRTQISSQTAQKILNSNHHYILPNFTCHLLKDTISFTLQVPNVNPESVEYCYLNNSSGFHLAFLSMGSGFFTVNYAICVLLQSQIQIENDTFSVEVWDNNVIAQVKLICHNSVYLTECYVGTDESNVELFKLPALEPSTEMCKPMEKDKNTSNDLTVGVNENLHSEKGNFNTAISEDNAPDLPFSNTVSASSQDESPCVHSQPSESQSQEKDENKHSSKSDCKKNGVPETLPEEDKDLSVFESASSIDESTSSPHRQHMKSRTVSESHQGNVTRCTNRGILKIGRSLSESSVDDYASWSAEKMEKTKKTVRFSEVISKQIFRMNSSILGQRKKNQRKMKNKKRAQERRLSESGGESEGENESVAKAKNSADRKEMDIWSKEPDSSSCDVSEVSEVSDISESDDGQKEEGKPAVTCPSRKSHKRRGKKSARKNAATAKLQFMEN